MEWHIVQILPINFFFQINRQLAQYSRLGSVTKYCSVIQL